MLKLFNTLTKKKEIFKPIKNNIVGIYSCGPTTYDYPHIGNYKAFITADLLKRYLKYKGYKVKQVMNITDVDDKTIKGSKKEGKILKEFTKKYERAFFEDLKILNIERAEVYPRATEHIKEMVALVKRLIKNGYAYKSEDGSIYFKISKFKNYGRLANIKGLKVGARIKQDEYEKENVSDFALWKSYDKEDGDVFWETEISKKGRPGWHIECSAMSMKYLGESFDIHSGGVDLIFPHHENEIAQSECATGKRFVKYWVHNEWMLVNGKKMSKSLGNFYTLRDLLDKDYDARAIRYLLISSHYRQQMNFTLEGLEGSKHAVERLQNFYDNVKNGRDSKGVKKLVEDANKKFDKAMDDDLNISEALGVIFDFIRDVNKVSGGKLACNFILKVDSILGVLKFKEDKLDKEIEILIEEREEARKKKNFKKADKIRNDLLKKGIILEDTKDGVRFKRK